MTSFQVYFHATPLELADLVRAILDGGGVHAVAFTWRPTRCWEVSPDAVEGVFSDPQVTELIVTRGAPTFVGGTYEDFLLANPGCLVLQFGRECASGLTVSRVFGMVERRAWRDALRELERRTAKGALVRSDIAPGQDVARGHRISPAAAAFVERGGKLRAFETSPAYYLPLRAADGATHREPDEPEGGRPGGGGRARSPGGA